MVLFPAHINFVQLYISLHFSLKRHFLFLPRAAWQLRRSASHLSSWCWSSRLPSFHTLHPVSSTTRVEKIFIVLRRLDVWTVFVIKLFPRKPRRKGPRQSKLSNDFGNFLRSAAAELAGAAHQLAEYWSSWKDWSWCPRQLSRPSQCICPGHVQQRHMQRFSSFSLRKFLALGAQYKRTFSTKNGDIHDCYIAKFWNDFKSIRRFGSSNPCISLHLAVVAQFTA